MPPKIRNVLQQLREAGWQQVQQTGSRCNRPAAIASSSARSIRAR